MESNSSVRTASDNEKIVGSDPVLLRAERISKTYGGIYALKSGTVEVVAGSVTGLVGENGAGKSTLVKVLSGVVERDAGSIELLGESLPLRFGVAGAAARGIRVVHQDQPVIGNLPAGNSVFLGNEHLLDNASPRSLRQAAEAILRDELGWPIGLGRLGRDLAPDERVAVAIAGALVAKPKILILDEPTAYLDRSEAKRVFQMIEVLKQRDIGVLYISHFIGEVFEICDQVTVVREGETVWSSPVSATVPDHVVREMVGRSINTSLTRGERVTENEAIAPTVEVNNLILRRGGDPLSFSIKPGQIVSIVGLEGSGVADVSDILSGNRKRWVGSIRIGDRSARLGHPRRAAREGVLYVPRDRSKRGMFPDLSVRENLVAKRLKDIARYGLLGRRSEKSEAFEIARDFGVRMPSLDVPVSALSGGNQQKTLVGRVLRPTGSLVVLDEPTVGVDIGSREEIYVAVDSLRQKGVAVLLLTSDVAEALRVSDRVIVLHRGDPVLAVDVASLGADAQERVVGAVTGASSTDKEAVKTQPVRSTKKTVFKGRRLSLNPAQLVVASIIVLLYGIISFNNPLFLSWSNLVVILGAGAAPGLLAAGISLTLMVNGWDMNIGGMSQLAGGVFTLQVLSNAQSSLGMATFETLALAAILGLIAALLVGLLKLPGFVVTVGLLFVSLGLHLLNMGGVDRQLPATALIGKLGPEGFWNGLSLGSVIAVLIIIVLAVFLRRSVFGLRLRAAEQGRELSDLRGINPLRLIIFAYVGSSLLGGLGGISRTLYGTGASATNQSITLLLVAVAGSFLGRAFTRNGAFSPTAAFVAGIVLAGIENGLIVMGFSNQASSLVMGIVLFVAIAGGTVATRSNRPRFVIGQEKVI